VGRRDPLPAGKLRPELLAELLAGLGGGDAAVVQGPGIGLDAAVLDIGGAELLVAKTDPITFATDAIGYYAVAVNSNDLAACGARPRWMMAVLLLPAGGADEDMARDAFRQLGEACDAFRITMVGGHTEVTSAVSQPVVVASMLGLVPRNGLVTPAGLRAGDVLLLAGSAGVEGTAVIARERGPDLLARGYSEDAVRRCAGFLHDPGISALRVAEAAVAAGGVHAMHDPTEGGVAMGLWELALASGMRLIADPAAVPLLPETQRICADLGLDPLGLISSGSMLIATGPEAADGVRAAIEATGAPCVILGRAESGPPAVVSPQGKAWPRYDQDELTRAL